MNQSKPLFIFYLLVGYICLQLIWWNFLLFQMNNEVHQLKTELSICQQNNSIALINTKTELENKLHKRKIMLFGEAGVFLLLLVLGILKTRNAFNKEFALAEQQKNFLLSITHELKSPIAAAKLGLQTLLKRDLEKEKQQEIITNILKDTERLNGLVDNLLIAVRIDNTAFPMHKENINLADFISEVLNFQIFKFSNFQIHLKIQPDVFYEIDKLAFTSVILNLLENAVKYSPEKSQIKIELEKNNTNIILRFIDEGIGISDNEKENIFKKFYRIGNEETRNTKGTGLGLYIVKYLVEKHNGKIFVRNNSPKGSIFEIIF